MYLFALNYSRTFLDMYNHYFSSKSQFPMTSSYFLHACLKEVLAEHHFLLSFHVFFFGGMECFPLKESTPALST